MTTDQNLNITVLGVGCAGVRVVNRLHHIGGPAGRLRLLAVDTDMKSLENCSLPDCNKLLADAQWRHGRGCGGDFVKGQRSMARERSNIEQMITNSSMLIVVGGLGGGTSSGAMTALSGILNRLKIPGVFLLTSPFSLEGHTKLKLAEDTIKELLPTVDVLLNVPNDLLFSVLSADTSALEAFQLAEDEIARTVIGVSELLRVGNLLPTDFTDLRSVLKGRKSFCAVGVGSSALNEGLNPCHIALERMLNAPLLGGSGKLKDADVVILSMLGGTDMNIGDVRSSFDAASKFIGPDVKLIVGANVDPNYVNLVQLTAIAIKYDGNNEALAEKKSTPKRAVERGARGNGIVSGSTGGQAEQIELPLVDVSRGIFRNSTPFIYNGEDLDIPTFQRHSIVVDGGE